MSPRPDNDPVTTKRRVRLLRRIAWSLAFVAFFAGFYVGLNVNARAGATLWMLTAFLALAPFISHRDKLQS